MSYIIAFVQFTGQGDVYPVECLRTDVDVGDAVIVHQPNRRLTPATVVQIRYLSWNCGGQIKGKVSEAEQGKDGFWSLRNCPSVVGLVTSDAFVAELKRQGWVPLKRGHIHLAALTNSNQTLSANILVRRNGIDLQILPARRIRSSLRHRTYATSNCSFSFRSRKSCQTTCRKADIILSPLLAHSGHSVLAPG